MFKKIDIDPNDIKAILKYYCLEDVEIHNTHCNTTTNLSNLLAGHLIWYANDGYGIDYSKSLLLKESAMLIKFLRACEGNTIKLEGEISKPQGKQTKNTFITTSISNHDFLTDLELFVNSWLKGRQDGLFQQELGIECKESLKWDNDDSDPFFTYPYTDDELCQIIDYYDKLEKSKIKYNKNGVLGRIATRVLDVVKTYITDWGTDTKLYSFVYDVMLLGECTGKECITDDGYKGPIGNEKYQEVRKWIIAYNKDVEKYLKK